jgi:uncharacterized damage-inducible protein DinB
MSERLTSARMQEKLGSTQAEFLRILNEANEATLYHRTSEDVWSMAQVLAHISEARQFFIRETLRVKAAPGSRMGRTMDDAIRLATVKDHAHDSAEQLRTSLITSYKEMMRELSKLTDSDLEIKGEHVKFGTQTLAEFLVHFVVEHDQKHVGQAQRCLENRQ